MADYQTVAGPAKVPYNGTIKIATGIPAYATIDPTQDDETHIATTAYVKGAYNDVIVAINRVQRDADNAQLYIDYDGDMSDVEPADQYILTSLDGLASDSTRLVTGGAVKTALEAKRVEIWTTWDDDTAKQQVAFVNAQ